MKQKFNIHVIIDPMQKNNFENSVVIDFELGIIRLELIFNSFLSYQEFSEYESIVLNYDKTFYKSFYQHRKDYPMLIKKVCDIEKIINDDFKAFVKLINTLKIHLDFKCLNDFSFQHIPTGTLIYINTSQLNLKDILKILSNKNIGENCFFYDKYNEGEYLSYEKMLLMYQRIGTIVKDIEYKNLSPLELVYYIYDIVRERIYHVEDDGEEYTKSRNLANILEGEDIVCLGFSNLFAAICDYFGIYNEIIYWKNKDESKRGHASNLVFINDDKYNVHKTFTMDATWDSKKSLDDNTYINRCNHAFIPIADECILKQKHNLYGPYATSYNLIKSRYDRYKAMVDLNAPAIILGKEIENFVKSINFYNRFLGISEISIDIGKLLNDPLLVKDIYESFLNYKIPFLNIETLINVINVIRHLEIEKNPEMFDDTITADDIAKTNAEYKYMLNLMNFKEIILGRKRKKPTY